MVRKGFVKKILFCEYECELVGNVDLYFKGMVRFEDKGLGRYR